MICGVTVLVVHTEEFEPLVIFSSDDSDLRSAFAAITHRALYNLDPFVGSRVVIFGVLLLLAEANVGRKLLMSRSLHQATLLHKLLRESVHFMIDLCSFLQGIRAGFPSLDLSVLEIRIELALLARRLIEFFLEISIEFGFGFFGIRTWMAGPVIAYGFHGRRDGGCRRGSIVLPIRSIRHWQSSDKETLKLELND
jgi:hypothetical protein